MKIVWNYKIFKVNIGNEIEILKIILKFRNFFLTNFENFNENLKITLKFLIFKINFDSYTSPYFEMIVNKKDKCIPHLWNWKF